MTPEEKDRFEMVNDVIDHVKLGNPFKNWKVRFLVVAGEAATTVPLPYTSRPETQLQFQMYMRACPDRETGAHRALLVLGEVLPLAVFRDRHDVLRAIRKLVHQCMTHEADEALFFDGTRPFDPHPPPPK